MLRGDFLLDKHLLKSCHVADDHSMFFNIDIFNTCIQNYSPIYLRWYFLGGPIGSLMAGGFATKLGRKKALMLNAALFVISSAVMAGSINIYMLMLGRVLVGFAAGMVSVIVPLYLGRCRIHSIKRGDID